MIFKLQKETASVPKVLLSGIVFLTFFQLLTEFVEAIYLFGLLGTEIPPEIGLVVLFFSPLFLLLLRKQLTSPIGLKIILTTAFLARVLDIILPTRGRLIVSGIGFAALLLFFPTFLSTRQKLDKPNSLTREAGAGLGLAIFLLVFSKALNSGSDLTALGMYRIISWTIMGIGLIIVWQLNFLKEYGVVETSSPNSFQTYFYVLGIASVAVLLYFVISAPNIISRWGGASNNFVHIILLSSWLLVGIWWINQKSLSTTFIFGMGGVFVLSSVLSILPHQVEFPLTMDSGYPLSAPQIEPWQNLPAYFMVALSPALLIAFLHYLNQITNKRQAPGRLAGAFAFGSGFILFMVLAQVFTTVYDYIPVIGPAFRDKYWLVILIPGILSFLPLLIKGKQQTQIPEVSSQFKKNWLWSAGIIAITSIIGMFLTSAHPSPPSEMTDTLRVFTYNIQQGYDDQGERNFDGQLSLIRSLSPDIIGLQECDTARIAGGNADVVAFMANHLNMYSYYGPSSITGTFGIALLSRYPIENAKTYYLFSEGEQVALIEADIIFADQTFKVYVTHLGNGGPIIQMRQMLELMQGQTNVIAMGDFNFRPYEEPYAITTKTYSDAYLIAQQTSIPTLWGETETFDIDQRIDHIFLSNELRVTYLEYLTQPESDHPGLFAEIGW